jgi:hypothetical protein
MSAVLRVLTAATGSVVAIEAVALFVGLFLVASGHPWAGLKNGVLIWSDIVGGACLIYLAARGNAKAGIQVFYCLLGVLMATHVYREWESFAGAQNAFCANTPLFVFNNIKLLGLAASAIASML